jgi:D-alanine-D-alanine ligase
MDGDVSFFTGRVALLHGGNSAEREISLASGRQAALALSLAGHVPVLIDPAEIDLSAVDWPTLDVCFLALHGGAGEDGRIQQKLERFGVPYTGSSPGASRLAMNKSAAKKQFAQCGVPSLPCAIFSAAEMNLDRSNLYEVPETKIRKYQQQLAALGFPLVIKPESQGSSLGVSVAAELDDVPRCLANAAQFDDYILAEPYVAGREFTISLLGRKPLPMIEIAAPQRLFTYEAKYSSPTTEYRFNSSLPPEVETQLYRAAIAAAEALDTAGLVRVDLMLDGHLHPWVLEVNTIPGMTARSLAPRAAQAAGIEMPALVDWMVHDALRRWKNCAAVANRTLELEAPL